MRNSVSLPLAKEWLQRGREPVTATRIGKMIYTSGVPGIDRKTGLLAAGAERQFAAAFDNLTALLEAAGAALSTRTGYRFTLEPTVRRARPIRPRCRKAWKCS